ncbi:MAG: hypothetical protein AABY14_02635 [Nanoarchaeota archaeon]
MITEKLIQTQKSNDKNNEESNADCELRCYKCGTLLDIEDSICEFCRAFILE